jgi:hypothetical protein
MQSKIEGARRQLGTALALYLQDGDPVSVHCLAGGGSEVIEFYASKAGREPFVTRILRDNPEIDLRKLRRLQRQYWAAFKHATRRVGKGRSSREVERDDEELLANFTDEQNNAALLIGWSDYARATRKMPIEAQVYQTWWIARNIEKLDPQHSREPYENVFPNINSVDRREQKGRLRDAIERARSMPDLMNDPKTDPRPLILPWPMRSW